jgi:hypothetical protein
MEREPGFRWSEKVVRPRTYVENLQRLAEERWMEVAAQWLTRHGGAAPAPGMSPLTLRGVRGLTSDGEPHRLRGLGAGLRKRW